LKEGREGCEGRRKDRDMQVTERRKTKEPSKEGRKERRKIKEGGEEGTQEGRKE
jgi:hypothetical protein